MRKPFIAGNWKMNTSREEATGLATAVKAVSAGANCDIAVCVPFPHLGCVSDVLNGSNVIVGAQDVYWEASGAFTGAVSPSMVEDYDVVIVGHSERRGLFGETSDIVRDKVAAVLETAVNPIVCVGESLSMRKSGDTNNYIAAQVKESLAGIELGERITVAYEPIWAIGTGETATPEVAQETCAFIRDVLRGLNAEAADAMRIQYGGSVNSGNAEILLGQPDIDGALVGGASLKADQFQAIIAAVN